MAGLGLDSYSYSLTMEDPAAPRDVFWFLKRVADIGLRGCQIDPRHIPAWSPEVMNGIGAFCAGHALYLELGTWRYDFDTVSRRLELAAEAGARCLRTFYGGYRYEMSADDLRRAIRQSVAGLKRLADVAERARLPLALENHEEFRAEEIVGILDAVDSPWVRCCLDTGNGMAVGEDPLECV